MATYSDLGTISALPDFRNRVAVAMHIAAINIYSESATALGHAARASYATKVLTGSYNVGEACLGVMQSASVQGSANVAIVGNGIADTDIQTQVNGIWNALAGA
jgi:hypothetical protein